MHVCHHLEVITNSKYYKYIRHYYIALISGRNNWGLHCFYFSPLITADSNGVGLLLHFKKLFKCKLMQPKSTERKVGLSKEENTNLFTDPNPPHHTHTHTS